MYGFEAIAAHNGWAIAAVGIGIVFSGLLLLSFAISQIHNCLTLWEKRDIYIRNTKRILFGGVRNGAAGQVISSDIKDISRQYFMLTQTMGETFPLPKLLKLAIRRGMTRPHYTINKLLHANLIIPDGEGYYQWSQKAYDKVLKR